MTDKNHKESIAGSNAVDARELLAQHRTFGSNSWRGDHYEPFLRQAIATTNSKGD